MSIVHPGSGSWFYTHPGAQPANPFPPISNKTYFVCSPSLRGSKRHRIRIRNTRKFIFGVEEETWRECLCVELEAEGGEPELVEQLSGQLAADSRAVLEVVMSKQYRKKRLKFGNGP